MTLTPGDHSDRDALPITDQGLLDEVAVGDHILTADGTAELAVVQKQSGSAGRGRDLRA